MKFIVPGCLVFIGFIIAGLVAAGPGGRYGGNPG